MSVATMIVTSVEMPSIFQTAGVAGFILYILGFASLQFGFLNGNGNLYATISVTAATLVLISLTEMFNLASALIQMSWIVIGICGIILRTTRRKKPSFSARVRMPSTKKPLPRQSTLLLRPGAQVQAPSFPNAACSSCINFPHAAQNSLDRAVS